MRSVLLWLTLSLAACPVTPADRIGVGASCLDDDACPVTPDDIELVCLTEFTGGYCGLVGCEGNVDCPAGSACVDHEGTNYCYRACLDKSECNIHRGPDEQSNCSSNITFVDADTVGKACVPPSAGD